MVETKLQENFNDYSQYEGSDREFYPVSDDSCCIKNFVISFEHDGERLDKVLADLLPDVSRSRIKTLIEEKAVKINGQEAVKPKTKLAIGDEVAIELRPRLEDQEFIATPMDIDIRYEDDDILVVNKPAGLVVHPAAGHWDDTLLNGLLAYNPIFSKLPRAGIVHRLDRDTSGLMVVSKNEKALLSLVRQLQERTVKREYWAIARGVFPKEKIIDQAIERDPRNPLRFITSNSGRAKEAYTTVRLIDTATVAGKSFSWVACRLKTGRTHQIRVHMESQGFPLVGDPVYRNRLPLFKDNGTVLSAFRRQALHASRLGLIHPQTGEVMEWFAEPPEDFQKLMEELGFGPADCPSKVFNDSVIAAEAEQLRYEDGIGTVSSWDDFDFGDDEDEE
jgi:23S rRNA pseudouridine1911/1915/1917 synthase